MRILAVDTNHELLIHGLRKAGFQVDEDYISTKETIEKTIEIYDGLIIRSRFPVDRNFLSKAKNLKFIGRVGAGLENINQDYAKERNIILFNAPEGNRDSLAEHALGMLLMLMHRLRIADLEVRNGIWLREENRGDELMGKTVGILGYGNMGKAFARRLSGLGVEVICYDILNGLGDDFAIQVGWDEFLVRTDVLSLHTPESPGTRGLINSDFINSFRKSIYFINTARGKSVVTSDLVLGIQSGKIKGACLDVLEYEKSSFENLDQDKLPNDFRYLLKSDKVILTPHIAGWTIQSKEKLAQSILSKILDWMEKNG